MLRARSAVQRFPVVEWRQRMEDFHRRSINMSRSLAASNAFRASDCDGGGGRAIADHDDWNPEFQAQPTQPNWDAQSINEAPRSPGPPGSPGQWTPDTLNANTPPRLLGNGPRSSFTTDAGSDNESGYFAHNPHGGSGQDYGGFLERANKTIAKDQKHVPDPFLDAAPTRPFGAHSRASSVESIASIVDEKQNSPLNKAIASVCYNPYLRIDSV
jgi:alpha-1,3-glucan synthase